MKTILAFLLLATLASAAQISVQWQDNSTAEDGFIIERSTDSKLFVEIGRSDANVAQFNDNLPTNGDFLYYRICAFQQNGARSGYSNVATWARPLPQATPTPTPTPQSDPNGLEAPTNAVTATKP